MARGKQTCKILKEIRRQIAAANDIEYVTSDCRYKGDCPGTCPKCEAEVRYLEEQLRARSLAGKRVMLAGVSAGMILLSGCSGSTTNQQANPIETEQDSDICEVTRGYSSSCEDEEEEVYPAETPEADTPITELLIVGGIEDEEIEAAPRTMIDIPEGVGGILDAPVEAKPEPNPDSDEPMQIQYLDTKPEFPGMENGSV